MSDLARWESRFAAQGYLFGTAPNAFLATQAELLKPGMKVLSIGDGDGRNGVWLAEQGLDVATIDFSPTAVAKAKALAAERGVVIDARVADLFDFSWPRSAYDAIVAIFVQFAPPAERAVMFDGIRQALRPGGLLLMEGYTSKQLDYGTGGPKQVERLYTRALLEAAFGDFARLEISEYEAEVDEGSGHKGMSALVDLVGQKDQDEGS